MKVLSKFRRESNNEVITDYEFSHSVSIKDIYDIVDLILANNIQIYMYRLSNSEYDENRFCKIFKSREEFGSFYWEPSELNISDLGIFCSYEKIPFRISFDLGQNKVYVAAVENMNLESLLQAIENLVQKKTR